MIIKNFGVLRAPTDGNDDGGGDVYGVKAAIAEVNAPGAQGVPEDDQVAPVEPSAEDGAIQDFTSQTVEPPAGEDAQTPANDIAPVSDTQTPAPSAPQTLRLDPESIAALRAQVAPQAAPSAPAGLDPAQIRAILNPVEITPDFVAKLSSEDPAVRTQGFQELANMTVKNAVSIAKVLIQQEAAKFSDVLTPITRQHEEAQLSQTKNEFFGAYKDLARYDKIVKMAAAEVSPTKADGSSKSKQEIFKEVAEQTRSTLKSLGINLSQPANPGAGGNNVPKPNGVSPFGRSGGDNNGQLGKGNNPDADIY